MYSGNYRVGEYSAFSAVPIYQQYGNNENAFIQKIQQIIKRDPTFKNPQVTGGEFLKTVSHFFSLDVNPALTIPELYIGNGVVSNISCLELVYRLSINDFEGL